MAGLRKYGLHTLGVLLLAVLVIAAMDWLSASLKSVVESNSATWWGQQEEIPYWGQRALAGRSLERHDPLPGHRYRRRPREGGLYGHSPGQEPVRRAPDERSE